MMLWTPTSKKLLLKTFLFNLYEMGFKSQSSGKEGLFDVLETRNWVNVVALTPENKVVMVRQFRFGTQEVTLEFPAGAIDAGENPIDAAKRELLEETGSHGKSVIPIGKCRPNPAFLNNTCYIFLARGVEFKKEQKLDEHEEVSFELMEIDEVNRLIKNGTINHAISIAAWHYFTQVSN